MHTALAQYEIIITKGCGCFYAIPKQLRLF